MKVRDTLQSDKPLFEGKKKGMGFLSVWHESKNVLGHVGTMPGQGLGHPSSPRRGWRVLRRAYNHLSCRISSTCTMALPLIYVFR